MGIIGLPSLQPNDNVINVFESYWSENRKKAFETLCAEENMVPEQLEQIVTNYGFYNRLPKQQDIGKALSFKPKILERKTIFQRVGDKIQDFINTFIDTAKRFSISLHCKSTKYNQSWTKSFFSGINHPEFFCLG